MGRLKKFNEMFDTDELKRKHEISYLSGKSLDTYEPMGIEKMNLNSVILQFPVIMSCIGDNHNDEHYSTYEMGIYLFSFKNGEYHVNLAMDLSSNHIDFTVVVYELPIEDLLNPDSSSVYSYGDNCDIKTVVEYLNSEFIDILYEYGFEDVVEFGDNINKTRMN